MKDLSQQGESMLQHMEKLVGQRITGLLKDAEKDPEFVGFQTANYEVWVLCDPEGNGPGFLDIERKGETK